ncbi:MAG: NUDIX hydrolase [Thiobacillaceae bacterium]|jgi:ADP-ribose pyrophosphatase YjhB (NUDIX family)|nr:NUDIX hydrolase [Thiobacillaceae bacterium]
MSESIWKPHVVVAAVIEEDGRFLLVEEHTDDGLRFNQPAGHLEEGEGLLDAVRREVFEETAHHFEPEALLGIYRWRHPDKGRTYLRFAFLGQVTGYDPTARLDPDILRAAWMSADEIRAARARHRSPLVARCLEDYLAGQSHSIDLIKDLDPA